MMNIRDILKQYLLTYKILWKLMLMNLSNKPLNKIPLSDYFDLDDVIKQNNTNLITTLISILSILMNKSDDEIRGFRMNKFTNHLLQKWILVLFQPIEYEYKDFSNSTFSDFIDNEKLIEMGNKYLAIKTICERNNININKSQDCLEYYYSYMKYCVDLKKKFSGVFIKKDDDDDENITEEVKTFNQSQNKSKERIKSNWLWYNIINKISNNDITKYDDILNMPVEKVLTNIAFIQVKDIL
jgi:hypothetical protein